MQIAQVKNNEIQNVVELFLEQYRGSQNTKRNYTTVLRMFFEVNDIKDITLWQIKKVQYKDIQKWILQNFEEGKSDNTIKRNVSVISSFFEYCEAEGVCKSPVDEKRIKRLLKNNLKKEDAVKGTALTKEEINILLNTIQRKKHEVMFTLLFQTGVRVSELVNIKKEDFEYHNECWFVKIKGKGRKFRYVPLKEEVFRMVEDYMDEFNITEGRIFPITEGAVNKALYKYTKKIGFKHLSSHDGRRTVITGLIKNGANMVEVQQFAGHSSMTTTRNYFRDYDKYNAEVLNRIDW